MTTNQTIDGVPREKPQRAIHCILNGTDTTEEAVDLAEELRALLDADKVNNRQMGLMQFVEAHQIKPAAQPQDEPVAYEKPHYDNHYGYAGGYVDWGCPRDVKAVLDHVESVLDSVPEGPLYAEQPAPVAVARKLEMAHVVRAHMEIPGCPVLTSNQCHALAMKLNSCHDEVTSLDSPARMCDCNQGRLPCRCKP